MHNWPMPEEFVRQSLELHLFWARIMKEHMIFLESGFMGKDQMLIQEADGFKCQFEEILHEAICLADGRISAKVLKSGELFTNMTLRAEEKTQDLTCIPIATQLTVDTMNLRPAKGHCGCGCGGHGHGQDHMHGPGMEDGFEHGHNPGHGHNPELIPPPWDQAVVEQVKALNEKAYACACALYDFTKKVLEEIKCCNIFSWNFPSIYHHQLEETEMYKKQIQSLKSCHQMDPTHYMVEMQKFWDHIMMEHAEVMSHLFDPQEKDWIKTAQEYAKEYERLLNQFSNQVQLPNLHRITNETIALTEAFKQYKAVGTEGILCCRLRSLILPLLADHLLREAIHYLGILGMPLPEFKGGKG